MTDATKDLQRFNITDKAIAELGEKYLSLTIDGIEDKKGAAAVRSARLDVKSRRISVERVRKELKAEALAYGRAVDGESNRIKNLLGPIEDHLTKEEGRIQAELDRIQEEKAEAAREKLRGRMKQLNDVNALVVEFDIEALDDEEFAAILKEATETYARKQEAAGEQRKEAVRLSEERMRLEKQKAAQEAEQKKLTKEKEALAEERHAAREADLRAEQKEEEDQEAAAEAEAFTEPAQADVSLSMAMDPIERAFREGFAIGRLTTMEAGHSWEIYRKAQAAAAEFVKP